MNFPGILRLLPLNLLSQLRFLLSHSHFRKADGHAATHDALEDACTANPPALIDIGKER